ncbi:MAG TPA: hypothetical protein PK289_02980 [Bacteroidia bacterium]|nr:hypothetical protein [Bacteroidia bacterium]
MKQILTIIALLISLSSYGQLVRIDSTWSSKRIYHTNHIGYRIGTDSIRTKDVRATLDGGDTFHIITDSLVSRTKYAFITSDSLTPYFKTVDFDEKAEDIIGSKIVAGSGLSGTYNDGTGELTLSATGGGGGGLTDEQVRDTTVAMFTVGPSITWNEDDANDSIYLDVSTNPLETAVQRTLLGKNFSAWVSGAGGSPSLGIAITTVPGVANTGTVSSTSPYLRRPMKTEYRQTTATTSNVAQIRSQRTICRGTEGYIYTITWAPVAGLSNANDRAFAGLKVASGDVSDVNPNTLTTVIGMGYNDATDSNFKIYHNDGSGTATEVDLGSSFPIPTTNETDFYTLILYVPNPGTTIYYKVIDEKDGTSVTGSVNSNIPDPATFLTAYAYTSVGGTSSVTTLGLFSIYSMVLDNY